MKVINTPWVPQHQAKHYLTEAETLNEFQDNFTEGLQSLTPAYRTPNPILFVEEVEDLQLHPDTVSQTTIPVMTVTIGSKDDESLNPQIIQLCERLKQRNLGLLGQHRLFHIMGLVGYCAYRWLFKTRKANNKDISWLDDEKLCEPRITLDSLAKNTIYTVTSKNHATQHSPQMNSNLLYYYSKQYLSFCNQSLNQDANEIPLDQLLRKGKEIVQSSFLRYEAFQPVRFFKNFLITRDQYQVHLIASRPQKALKDGEILHYQRTLLFPILKPTNHPTM